jgi:hypothetical protein
VRAHPKLFSHIDTAVPSISCNSRSSMAQTPSWHLELLQLRQGTPRLLAAPIGRRRHEAGPRQIVLRQAKTLQLPVLVIGPSNEVSMYLLWVLRPLTLCLKSAAECVA